jgi:hypothetical protein
MLKLLVALIAGLTLGWTATVVAAPGPAETEPLRWSEFHAVGITSYKLWERVSSCNRTDCFLRDPMLQAFTNVPSRFRYDSAMLAVDHGQWSATLESPGVWRVEVQVSDSDPYIFYASEWNGVVASEVHYAGN